LQERAAEHEPDHRSSFTPPERVLRTHVFSVDHKVIGKQYLDLALVAVCTGMFSPG